MTRINAGILPYELPDKLLLAELREIKRIPNTINSGKARIENIPVNFCLGKGHVKFFYNKIKYLHRRYCSLYDEAIARGFNVSRFHESFNRVNSILYNDWDDSGYPRKLLIERIVSEKGYDLIHHV